MAVAPGGSWLAAAADGVVELWDTRDGSLRATLAGSEPLTTIAFSKDLRWIATLGRDGSARVWHSATARHAP
jgi:WD40 repeat protein